jgi:cytochrome c-type biogenesis protein CcmH
MRFSLQWGAASISRARYIVPLLVAILCIGTIHAQRTVTQDDVNAVAERMYCPICENIPLDDCGTTTCQAWKEEIRTQLMAGQSAEAIIDDFVRRYGEQVVGIPQNPVLRSLSLVTPWLMVGIALLIGVWTFRRWQVRPTDPEAPVLSDIQSDTYRDRIEQDVG